MPAPHCLRGVHVTWENPSRLQLFLAFVFQKLECLRESKVLAEYKKDKRGSEKSRVEVTRKKKKLPSGLSVSTGLTEETGMATGIQLLS